MGLKFTTGTHSGTYEPGLSLFEAAEALGQRPYSSCDKNGKCRECFMEVEQGSEYLSERSPAEAHLPENYRLACCAKFISRDGVVQVRSPQRFALQISTGGFSLPCMAENTPLQPAVARKGSQILLDGVEIAQADGPVYGAVADIGTTTVVLRVYDLESGVLVDSASFENPQRFSGSDVMSRISYEGKYGGKLLQRVLLNNISEAFERMQIDCQYIYEMLIAGNSAMRDIFFGLNVQGIGQKPYHSVAETDYRAGKVSTTSVQTIAHKLRLPLFPQARIQSLPLIGSHVGADAAACLLAVNMDRSENLIALMDMGTNTEVACGNRNQLFVASCPAGPAFEGGAIRCGMPGSEGAIERVSLNGSGTPVVSVIGNQDARGICGSGLIDAMSELLRKGLIDEYGRFVNGDDRFNLVADGKVYLHESDLGELAQAKSAQVAGLQILLKQQGVLPEQVNTLYLAGGFARHLDLGACRSIGIVPNLSGNRMIAVGNAAIEGLSIALLSVERRAALERYVKTATHVELETDPEFFDHFVEGCLFKPYQP